VKPPVKMQSRSPILKVGNMKVNNMTVNNMIVYV
jgi:hypothetical protein